MPNCWFEVFARCKLPSRPWNETLAGVRVPGYPPRNVSLSLSVIAGEVGNVVALAASVGAGTLGRR